MPKPQPQQTAWAPRVSIHPSIVCSFTASHGSMPVKPCLRNEEASEHEGKGHRAGTLRSGHHQQRATPKPHRHLATNAARVSVSPCSSHHGLTHIGGTEQGMAREGVLEE